MAEKKLICRICGVRDIDPDIMVEDKDYVRHNKWYAHRSCYELREKMRAGINVHETADEKFWREATFDYMRLDLKMDMNNGRFFKQWYQYIDKKKNGYTPKGIYFAILYFYEIQHGDKSKANGGIGIVSHIYEDSKAYWEKREREQYGIVASIEKQLHERRARERKVVQKKEIEPKKFAVDFSVLDELEEED